MNVDRQRMIVEDILSIADVKINGMNRWDIKIHNNGFYKRVLAGGGLALGESYMDGWWDCDRLDEFFFRILSADLRDKIKPTLSTFIEFSKAKLFNKQSIKRSKSSVEKHYDLKHELYQSFLDPYKQYTCGYFKDTTDLNRAQEQKLDLICRKLQLTEADRVLDIGCGWGGFAKFAAQKYGCHVTGINISDEQVKYAKEYCQGYPVKIVKSDYREFHGEFDKILNCGMIEHAGSSNYKNIMTIVDLLLKPDGLFLLHTIGGNKTVTHTADLWMDRHIFPNSRLTSGKQLTTAVEELFIAEDWHNFGIYYDKTLMAWHDNFNRNWGRLVEYYDVRFQRMWNYYLLCSAGSFRARKNQLWQIVYSKKGVPGGYESVR